MGKKGPRLSRSKDGTVRLRTNASSAMVAWANLVAAIVQTMRDEGVGADVIHGFLDTLDMANLDTLEPATLAFALHVTSSFRQAVPSND